jgi:alkanesulfonate monooxygenase SsuD/methylene tetrahydromethanopterin reductase-like flavin-dependent oxidoreductase (luciferase family)
LRQTEIFPSNHRKEHFSMPESPVGLVLGSALPPSQIVQVAKRGEELGFAELWLAEDYFFTGGIAGAAAVLGATQRIPVGLGIVSAMVRHPALLAMEISTLEHMYPGRLWPGIGLGVPAWVNQMKLMPKSQLGAMRECVNSVRRLLAGEELTEDGDSFSFVNVKLTYPVDNPVPVYMGVLGPKMLRLSGEIADGTVGSVLAGTAYIRWAREQIAGGMQAAGRKGHHRFAVFTMYAVDKDAAKAKEAVRALMAFYLAAVPKSALTDVYGIGEELAELAQGGPERLASEMPEQWVEDLVVAGEPEECAGKIRALLDAGADSVILFPVPPERAGDILDLTAAEVLPRV